MPVINVDSRNWDEEIIRSNVLTVVYFWHERCPWCREMEPIFNKVAAEYEGKVKFAKLNVLESVENRELAISLGVTGTPTLIFFCSGRAVAQVVGFITEEELRETVEDTLARHSVCIAKSSDLRDYIF